MHAIIIVDLEAELKPPRDLVERIRAKAAQFPVRVFTRFINPPGSLFRNKLGHRSCSPGTEGTRLMIEPLPSDLVFDKKGYGLNEQHIGSLRARGIRELTVTGMDTDACVLGVMFSLWDHGFDCHISEDLTWSSAGLHEKALEIAHQQFGR
jgi:nicotinamidase-related amidase